MLEQIALGALFTPKSSLWKTGFILVDPEFDGQVSELLSMRSGETPRRQRPKLVSKCRLEQLDAVYDDHHRDVAAYLLNPSLDVPISKQKFLNSFNASMGGEADETECARSEASGLIDDAALEEALR